MAPGPNGLSCYLTPSRALAPNSADKRLVNGFASLGLTPALLSKAFPFHLGLDRQSRVLQTGAVLRRLCPGLVEGSPVQASICIHDPKIPLDYQAICQHSARPFTLEILP